MASRWQLLPFALFLMVLPFPGTVAARLLLLVICVVVASYHALRAPGPAASIPCVPAIAAWAVVSLVSLSYAVDPTYSLGEIKNELGYTLMAFLAFFAIADTPAAARMLVFSLMLGLLAIGGGALVLWAGNGGIWAEAGPFGGSGVFSTYVVTLTPALSWLIRSGEEPTGRRLAIAAAGFAALLAVLTMQRAIWPALAAEALVLVVMSRHRLKPKRLVVVALVIVVAAIVGVAANQHRRFGHAQGSDQSASADLQGDSRLGFWPKVVGEIASHPASGAGFGRNALRNAYPQLVPKETPALWHAHNTFLNYGLAMGVPGILALAALFFAWALFFVRTGAGAGSVAGIAGLMLVVGVVIRNQFNDFFMRDMSLLFWALTGVFARQALADRSKA